MVRLVCEDKEAARWQGERRDDLARVKHMHGPGPRRGRVYGAVMGTNVVNTLAVEATAALAAALISFTVARVVVGVALISFTVARVVVCIANLIPN